MTNEQLIIYLYGIYPNGSLTLLYLFFIIMHSILMGILFLSDRAESSYQCYTPEDYYWNKLSNKQKVLPIVVLAILLFLSNLVPSRNTFLAIVATPTVMEKIKESMNDGKLKKVDELLDLALDKATKELKD